MLLGLSGVMLVMLSVLGSVGFFSAIGVKSTLIIMEVIPFLVLAVSFFLLHLDFMWCYHFAALIIEPEILMGYFNSN